MNSGPKKTLLVCLGVVMALAVACTSPEPWVDPCIERRAETMAEDKATEKPSYEYMRDVRKKYRPLLWGFPHYMGTSVGDYTTPDDRTQLDPRGGYGITLWVSQLTDQDTLPEEERVPECLEGVPVRIIIDDGDPRLLGGA